MSIIDRDTDQILSRFINVAEDAIGRHNIDEENVPPDRLIVDPGKAAFSPEERITIPEGMARDANGAADIASIEAAIRYVETLNAEGDASGTWKDWRDYGLLGVNHGSGAWFDLDNNPSNGIELILAGGTTVEERINRDLKLWGQH